MRIDDLLGKPIFLAVESIVTRTESTANAFRKIYQDHAWMGRSLSGPGSDPARTEAFRRVLQEFIRRRSVSSVIDIGCGDWASTRLVDWSEVDYLGIDVVPEVIAANRARYQRGRIRFEVLDATIALLPSADLAIIKEVLQHLPLTGIFSVLDKLRSFRWAILVNDIAHSWSGGWKVLWRRKHLLATNNDIQAGGYRLLSLRDPPFNLPGVILLNYENRYQSLRWTKEVLLWTNPDNVQQDTSGPGAAAPS